MEWILRHKLISIVITLVVAIGAWYFLSGSNSSAPVLAPEQSATAPAGTQDLVASLLALRAITLSGTIFSNPAFQGLRDFTTPIQQEPAGRSDPFAPLGQSAAATQASTKSASQFAPAKKH